MHVGQGWCCWLSVAVFVCVCVRTCVCVCVASLTQHHQGDGPTSSFGHVSMEMEQRAVCSGGLVVEVEAAAWLKLDFESKQD